MTATEQIELLLTGEAVVVVEAVDPKLCHDCKKNPRLVSPAGHTYAYCVVCRRKRLAKYKRERKAKDASKTERILRSEKRAADTLCAKCVAKPRRIYSSGYVSCYCVECDRDVNRNHRAASLAREVEREPQPVVEPEPLLPTRIVPRVRQAPAPKPHQWHITNVGKRNVYGQPIQEHGTPAVSYLSPAQIAEAKRNRSKVFGAGARV